MTKLILVLEFKWCKSNTGVYYFIDKETRELVIAIVYCYDSRLKMLSQETTLVLEWHKRTR